MMNLFCELCNKVTRFLFVRDAGIFEVYRCKRCGKETRYAVR